MNDPKVSILYFTGQGTRDETWLAARILAYTKNTRLQMTPDGWEHFRQMPIEQLQKELLYMSNSIPSSWEFADVTFAINDVTRACAQQITRTRTASYAMQSQRVTDMRAASWHVPDSVRSKSMYNFKMKSNILNYKLSLESGESMEDARGLLPMNIHCNLIAKYNLRSLVELLRARDSLRVQGEYSLIAQAMRAEVFKIWPWAEPFFEPKDKKAIDIIESVAKGLEDKELRTQLAKAADLLKR